MSQINIGGTTLNFKDSSFTGDQWESVASWVLNGGAETTEAYAKEAKSYAVGGTGLRTGEDTDNAKYYKEQSAASATKAETASNHPPRIGSNGNWEVWDFDTEKYVQTDYPSKGSASTVLGLYPTIDALEAAHPTGSAGSAWLVGDASDNVVYQWDVDKSAWVNVGKLAGPQGAQGEDGNPGPPGPKGDNGKSAYESAQEGGYSGTETDFYDDLADVSTKQSKITTSGILKGDGAGGVSKAVRGYDYAEPSHGVEATLTAADWSDGVQTMTILIAGHTPITARTNGSVRISQDATDEQFAAWCAAQPRVTEQATNTITIKAAGTVPTIDIPVEVLIV